MLFNTALFLWFFAAFFVLYSFVVLRHTPRLYLILVGSILSSLRPTIRWPVRFGARQNTSSAIWSAFRSVRSSESGRSMKK